MSLRTCERCGLEADTQEKLILFVKRTWNPYNRINLCKQCALTPLNKGEGEITKIHFKNTSKYIHLTNNPRIGVCTFCHKEKPEGGKQLHLHHIIYDEEDPFAYTIELCPSCHHKLNSAYTRQPYLRKCTTCGLEATNIEQLELFIKNKHSPYSRASKCKKCHNTTESLRRKQP